MKLSNLFVLTLLSLGMMLLVPGPAKSTTDYGSKIRLAVNQWQESELHFNSLGEDTERAEEYFQRDTRFTIGSCPVYWSNNLQWFGVAVDISFLGQGGAASNSEGLAPHPDRLSNSFMLRYPGGQVRPYLGLGPGLEISGAGSGLDINNSSVLFGFSCNF
jgi:hypothetical protein